MDQDSPLINFLKVAAHLHGREPQDRAPYTATGKDQERYGDNNDWQNRNQSGFHSVRPFDSSLDEADNPRVNTGTTVRTPNPGPSRRNSNWPLEGAPK